jgi:hypothetical protein
MPSFFAEFPHGSGSVGFGSRTTHAQGCALGACKALIFRWPIPLDVSFLTIQKGVRKWQDYVTERHLSRASESAPHPQKIIQIDIHHQHQNQRYSNLESDLLKALTEGSAADGLDRIKQQMPAI